MTGVKKLITEHLDIWLTAETEKKLGRGRNSGSSNSIYGVQKLRELILNLAATGKIVQRSDSKAIDLIEEIRKLQLSQKLKLKGDISIFSEKNKIFPANWEVIQIKQLGNVKGGKRIPKGKAFSEKVTPYVYLRVTDMKNESILDNDLKYISEDVFNEIKRYTISKNDIYITIAGTIGKVGKVPEKFHNMNLTENAAKITDLNLINHQWFIKVLQSAFIQDQFRDAVKQMAQPKLAINKVEDTFIPLPPLDEQNLIVAKVDELMQLCDQLEQRQNLSSEAHDQLVDTFLNILTNSSDADEFQQNWQRISENFDLLFTTEYSIEQLKQTILQLAVTGKLVKLEAMDETTKLEIHQHKINFSKKNSEANFVNFHGLNELKNSFSKNMEIFRLGDIADIVRGGSPRPAGDLRFYEGNIPFLKVADITRSKGKFVEGYTSTIKEDGLHKTRFIDSRTVLLTNSGATLGVPAICDFPTTFNDGVAAFINLSNHVFDEYLYLYLSTLTKWFLNVAAQGQGQPNLNTDIVKSTWIALPTRKVQVEIVDMVDNLFSIIDQLQTLQSKLRKTKVNLADSFVANALLDSNDRNEGETEDNIIQFKKPIEIVKQSKQKSADQIDLFADDSVENDIKLLSLAAEITFQLHTEPTFGHLKLQKLIYLCQQLKHMDLAADFKQHVAGPYDRNIAIYIDTEFKKRQWFSYHKDETPKYKQLRKCGEHKTDFERFFAKEASELNLLLGLFRTSKSDHIEIVATLFACWLRLLEQKQSVTEEQLLKDFYAWSEEKKRFSKAEVLTGYKWMHQYSIIPQV
ncbi:restriction endonuclease subunit S [Acinetobacter calcoaceticus]|uniref:restriction endonuclease subunit S n=1 Tax=Acinetobacter calcoaceticus TaxID=471 RepID=UPI00124D1CC0|nr:restriction endonuclease subunit S [Acinetobacter calcoaceticus]